MPRIDVLTDQPIGLLDQRIFGSFTEHLATYINCSIPSPCAPCQQLYSSFGCGKPGNGSRTIAGRGYCLVTSLP